MNDLSKIFENVKSNSEIILEKDRIYDVREDDSFYLEGYYCSNTAKKHENPNGMRKSAVYLGEKKNILIDGNGATVLIHGKMTPLLFDRCENITVKNLTIDYACPTMSEFTVLSNRNGECVIRINDECLFRTEGNKIIWHGEKGPDGTPYWEGCHNANGRHLKLYDPSTELSYDFSRSDIEFESIEQLSENALRVILKNRSVHLPEGCIIQTRSIVRDQTGSLFNRSKNLTFDSLRIKFMHGLGMVSQFCENVTFRNCDFTPSAGRTVASTADFFQFSGCKGDIIIDGCIASGAHDDYVNVHGTHLRIIEKHDNYSLTVRFMHDETWGFQAFEKGDVLDFIKWDTLIPYATNEVSGFERVNDTDIKLYFRDELPFVEIGRDVVENVTFTPNLHVKNCSFGPTSGRGILCTTRGKVIIENNLFRKLWGPALLIEDDCNFWFESGRTFEIIFRNNTVIHCDHRITHNGAPCTPKVLCEAPTEYVHKKLTVTDNTFLDPVCDSHLFHLEHLENAVIVGNTFDRPFRITSVHVGKITEENNKILS